MPAALPTAASPTEPRAAASRRPGPAPELLAAVLGALPARLARELRSAEVGDLVDGLVSAGWRPGQLASRLGAAPAQGSVEADAAHVRQLLRGLVGTEAPDHAHARAVAERERERAARRGPRPATDAVRERALARMRASVGGAPRRRVRPPPRPRPSCALCDGEGSWFVTPEVHLCPQCVAVLATGEARLTVAR